MLEINWMLVLQSLFYMSLALETQKLLNAVCVGGCEAPLLGGKAGCSLHGTGRDWEPRLQPISSEPHTMQRQVMERAQP